MIGLPIVLSIAVPARILYIGVLESSKEFSAKTLWKNEHLFRSYENPLSSTSSSKNDSNGQLIASISSGLAGGLAAFTTQILIVPMDVISQRQIVAEKRISAISVYRDVLSTYGFLGLYRGFYLSILSSIPGGAAWWATYGGAQHGIHDWFQRKDQTSSDGIDSMIKSASIQLIAGISAAISASLVTQPLDVIKVRLQVSQDATGIIEISKELFSTAGLKGFYRGLVPRITYLSLWGTILSGCYEYLKQICAKDIPSF